MKHTVYQHWDPLKVCAVGRCFPPEYMSRIQNAKVRPVMERICQETCEDLDKLADKLREFGVEVLRTDLCDDPDAYVDGRQGAPPGKGQVTCYPPMLPRDYTAMIGDTFYMPGQRFGDKIDIRHVFDQLTSGKSEGNGSRERLLAKLLEDALEPDKNLSTSMSLFKFRTRKNYHTAAKTLMGLDAEQMREQITLAETMQIGNSQRYPSTGSFYPFSSIEKWLQDNNVPIVYDQHINTATSIRCGKDLYFSFCNVINKLNQKSFDAKLTRLFPNNRINYLAHTGHSDGSTCVVKPGLVVSLKGTEDCEKLFPGWDICSISGESWDKVDGFLKMKEKNRGKYFVAGEEDNDDLIEYMDVWLNHWQLYVEESVFDVNMLVIDENNVICNGYNEKVFDAFERHGVTPHILNLRHRYFWDGGLHCVTSDISRQGECKDFFPDRDDYQSKVIA